MGGLPDAGLQQGPARAEQLRRTGQRARLARPGRRLSRQGTAIKPNPRNRPRHLRERVPDGSLPDEGATVPFALAAT